MAPSAAEPLRAATVSDACDSLGLSQRTLASGWERIGKSPVMTGRAFVVQTRIAESRSDPPYTGLLAALDQLSADDVWVISAVGRRDVAIWGELLTLTALQQRAAGALCDGAVRDVEAVRQLALPVFARGRCPADINGRLEVTGVGGALEVDGVAIEFGDLVVADDDGVVIVPGRHAQDVVAFARRKHEAERLFAHDVAAGMSAAAAFERHQVL